MKDSIFKICSIFYKIKSEMPTIRIGQFLSNFSYFVKNNYNKDIFYISDEELSILIEEYFNKITTEYKE